MRKNFTFLKSASIKLGALALVFLASTGIANAGETKWGDYYATLSAYPTGAGLVYAEVPESYVTESEDEMSDLFTDMKTPAESVDVKFMYNNYDTKTYFYPHAVPSEGWIVAGFSQAKVVRDEVEGEDVFVFNDSIYDTDNPSSNTYLEAGFSDADQTIALSSFPMAPTAQFYALFTHVKPTIAIGQSPLGTVSISKVCNEIGDDVTLTATPDESKNATFDYWVNMNTQEKIAQNPLEVKNIQESAVYEAHFKSDKAITMEFPEEGGYKIVYFDKGYVMPATNVVDNTFDFWDISTNNLKVTEDSSAYYIQPGDLRNWLYPGNPHILYGKGLMTFVENDEMQKSNSNELEWSGDNGVNVADLSLDKKYYSVNLEKKQFELLADDAVIAPKTAYFAMPVECYTAHNVEKAPSIVYWYKPETSTGIEEIQQETATVGNAKGIYSIDGKKMNAIPAKGLYIVNGKKVIKLK
ncbi:MAG: hypothetical protein KIG82_08610 [Prevotella sp.]|nr:hypothetical protein [Prevotella sp.]